METDSIRHGVKAEIGLGLHAEMCVLYESSKYADPRKELIPNSLADRHRLTLAESG